MTSEEVYELFGEPDFMGSGLYFVGYNDVGSFYFGGNFYDDSGLQSNGIVTQIHLKDRSWSINELISAAVLQHNKDLFLIDDESDYATESHINLAIEANQNEFTVYTVSLYSIFKQKGDYAVEEVGGIHQPLALTFSKNESGYYELLEYWKPQDGNEYTPSIRARFPENTWDKTDTQLYIEQQQQNCYDDALNYFLGAMPRNGLYRIDVATVVINSVADDTVENDCFIIKYFPGATVRLEEFGEEQHKNNWVMEYVDKNKNIVINSSSIAEISITDDLIGIYNSTENRYAMKFEKYEKNK